MNFPELERITHDPAVMGGKPCIRGMRVTVGTITGLMAAGADRREILRMYPYLEDEDITAALSFLSWLGEEQSLPLELVVSAIKLAEPNLRAGALVTIDPKRHRIHMLPIRKE